jgi:hypothetical protein
MSCKFLAPDLLCPILFSHDICTESPMASSFLLHHPATESSYSMAIKAPTLQACLFVTTPTSQLIQFFFVYKMRIFFIYNYPTGGTWLWTAKKIEFRKIVWSLGSYEFLPHPITLFMIISKKFAVCTSSCRDPSLQQFIYYIL